MASREATQTVRAAMLAWVAFPLSILWAILILVDDARAGRPLGTPVVVTVTMQLSDNTYAVTTRDSPVPIFNPDDPAAPYNPFDDPNISIVTLHGQRAEEGQRLTLYRNPNGRLAESPALSSHVWGGSGRDWLLISVAFLMGANEIAWRIDRRIRVAGNDHDERVRRRRAQGIRKRR
jgi:hypothetical protein